MKLSILGKTIIITLMGTGITYAEANHYSTFNEALKNGAPYLEFRLRYENARQAALKTADATTLRSKLGYISDDYMQTKFTIEAINVANFFGQHYNPGAADFNKPSYSLIADPKGTGITNFNFDFFGLESNKIVLGRQYLRLDNERFIGSEDVRQFPQTFDAISLTNTWLDDIELFYAFLNRFNNNEANSRASTGRNKLNTHLVNVAWKGFEYGKLSAYTYLNKNKTISTNSHLVIGIRAISNDYVIENYGFSYSLELAQQKGKFNNPNHYTAYYAHGEIGKAIDWLESSLGFERFTGHANNPNKSFITPFGSNRLFNGAAAAVTSASTNNRGFQDLYLKIGGKIENFQWLASFHNFRFDSGKGKKIGNEFDLTLSTELNSDITASATLAKFNPSKNAGIKSTKRAWIQIVTKFM